MSEQRVKDLIKQGDELFGKRGTLMEFWQDTAENFYPERADFTNKRILGDNFADFLDTSYPVLARRELGNTFGGMLRPTNMDWFEVGTDREIERDDEAARQWLERTSRAQRRATYDKDALFTRATKEGDHDYASFGQTVISCELNIRNMSLLYRCWHLRDVAWQETYDGKTCPIHRKWEPTAIELANRVFPGKVHQKVTEMLKDNPYGTVKCRHIVINSEDYDPPVDGKKWETPYVSIHFDVENEHIMEEVGVWNPMYVIPRWQTVSGSQYAYSPAVTAAIPDARLIQSMTYTLLTAGEMAVQPPMIGVQEAMRSDLNIFAGGFTAVDADYDERLGEVLRPMTLDTRGIPLGIEMARETKQIIADAFFLNKINLPRRTGDVTAYEVSQMVQEYIRGALPLFEPMEADYNSALCELTFDILSRAGAFGSPLDMPESLSDADIKFNFKNPLREAADADKGQKFLQAKQLLAEAAPLDPLSVQMVDAGVALRDALHGVGIPAEWMRDDEQMDALRQADAQEKQTEGILDTVSQGADIAEKVGNAGQALNEGGMG